MNSSTSLSEAEAPLRVTDYVNPFLGSDQHGNCLPGPYLPFSLVRLGPDVLAPENNSGYFSHAPIARFSHTHVSGTGGVGQYGNIGIIPFVGLPRLAIEPFAKQDETAHAGYYSVTLLPAGIGAELTVTPRVGVHRYTFPRTTNANILIDAGAVNQCDFPGLEDSPMDWPPRSTGGYVDVVSEREVVGRGDFKGGWGHGFPYSVYFYARFDTPFTERRFANSAGWTYERFADGPNARVALAFGPSANTEAGTETETVVSLRVGISYVSVAKARASVERECGTRDFDVLRSEARDAWEESLSRIRVVGGTDDEKTLFYSLFTRLLCMPSDLGVDDEFGQWHSGVRHFTDYYCLWDSVRNANSLLSLFAPEQEAALLNCLLDVADKTGWLPDAWIAGHSAAIQGGSSADILLCEAKLKGITGIDYAQALRQVRKNNEVVSPDPFRQGRYLEDWRDSGYVSTRVTHYGVSRHIEYAYQDWCIGRLAQALDETEVAERQFQSAANVWNLWDANQKAFAPKNPDGTWVPGFRAEQGYGSFEGFFYEGSSRQWSFSVHHDFAGLIARHGGPEAFVLHLDDFFARGMYHSKETMLHIPYLYTYAGRPDRTAERVRECLQKYFHNARAGLSDNEDMGCQSAFYMASSLGLYPIMGQDLYLLAPPLWTRSETVLGTSGHTLVIEAPAAGENGRYIVGASRNGVALERAWVQHHEIAGGAVLHLKLSDTPNTWGFHAPPPSPMQAAHVAPTTENQTGNRANTG